MQESLIVSRHGDNIFATGLAGAPSCRHLVPALTPADRLVDRRGALYVHAEPHGRHGMRIEIRRRRNDAVVRRITSRRSTVHVRIAGRT